MKWRAVSISCRRGFVSIGSDPVRKHVGIGMSERKRLPQRWISCGHWPIPCAKENPRRNKPFASKPKRSWLASRFEAGSKSILPRTAKRSEEHTSELQSHVNLVCRLLLEKKKTKPP